MKPTRPHPPGSPTIRLAAGTGPQRLAPVPQALRVEPDPTASTLLASLALESPFLRRMNSEQLALLATHGRLVAAPGGATLHHHLVGDEITLLVLAGRLDLRPRGASTSYGVAAQGAVVRDFSTAEAGDDVILLGLSADLLAALGL
jgi:hypothetical protein